MWIIVLLACLCVTLDCNAQEVTSADGFTVTETPRANQEIDWDVTRPSVTLNIHRGRYNSFNGLQNNGDDQSLTYSNDWRAVLMPINSNPYRETNPQRASRGQSGDHPLIPIFLRRPDSDLNWTLPFVPYPQPSLSVNNYPFRLVNPVNQFSPYVHPVNPSLFYPNALNTNIRGNAEITAVKRNQNTSETLANIDVTEPVTLNYENEEGHIFPNEQFPTMPLVPQDYQQVSDFRDTRGVYHYFPPLYYPPPYPVLPDRSDTLPDGSIHNSGFPQYDREVGSEVIENDSPLRERSVPAAESLNSSVDVLESESTPSEVVPSRLLPLTPPSIPPPDTLPLPFGAFPFGVLPPPVLPPVLPNPAFPRVLPVNTPPAFPGPLNIPRGNGGPDGLDSAIVADDRLPLETSPEALLPENSLQTGPEAVTDLPQPDQVIAGEKINTPKIPYEFGFDMNDGKGTDQHRQEISDGSGVVTGSYGYRDVFGVYRIVNYIADKNGFRAVIKSNEPGVASSGSADVVVMAEQPPPRAIAEGAKAIASKAIVVPDETADLIAEGSEKHTV